MHRRNTDGAHDEVRCGLKCWPCVLTSHRGTRASMRGNQLWNDWTSMRAIRARALSSRRGYKSFICDSMCVRMQANIVSNTCAMVGQVQTHENFCNPQIGPAIPCRSFVHVTFLSAIAFSRTLMQDKTYPRHSTW